MGKNKAIFVLLAVLVGWLGIHRMYLGTPFDLTLGIIYMLFWWTGLPLVLALLEAIYFSLIVRNDFRFKSYTVTEGK